MQHRLCDIARNRIIDTVLFTDFAIGHADQYSLELNIPNLSDSTVSTWHVDQLVEDYNKARDVSVFIQAQL